LEHHAKQRYIVTRLAELDKLLQRAEWAKVMAERQYNLQSEQNSVKVNYNVVDKIYSISPL
jgi:predicted transglutaminase-like protease